MAAQTGVGMTVVPFDEFRTRRIQNAYERHHDAATPTARLASWRDLVKLRMRLERVESAEAPCDTEPLVDSDRQQ